MNSVNDHYSSKVISGSASEKTLLDLAWKVDDLSRLSGNGPTMLTEIMCIVELLQSPNLDDVGSNVARRLTKLQDRLVEFVRGDRSIYCSHDFK